MSAGQSAGQGVAAIQTLMQSVPQLLAGMATPGQNPMMGRAAAMTGPAARASVAGGMGTQNDRAAQAQYQQAPAQPGVAVEPTAVDESMFPSPGTPGGGGGGGLLSLVQQLARGLSSLPRAPLNPAPYAGEAGPDPTRYEDSMFPPSQTTGLPPGMLPMPFNPAMAGGMRAQPMPNTPTSGEGMVVQPMAQPAMQLMQPPGIPQPQDLLANQSVDPLRAAVNRLPMPQIPGRGQLLADPRAAFVPQPPARPAGLGAPVPQPPVRPATMHDPSFNPGPGGDDGQMTMMRDINMLARERGLPPVFTI